MQYIAHDDDALAIEIAQRIAERVGIEKPLRGMRMPSIASVDHGRVGPLGDEIRSSR